MITVIAASHSSTPPSPKRRRLLQLCLLHHRACRISFTAKAPRALQYILTLTLTPSTPNAFCSRILGQSTGFRRERYSMSVCMCCTEQLCAVLDVVQWKQYVLNSPLLRYELYYCTRDGGRELERESPSNGEFDSVGSAERERERLQPRKACHGLFPRWGNCEGALTFVFGTFFFGTTQFVRTQRRPLHRWTIDSSRSDRMPF